MKVICWRDFCTHHLDRLQISVIKSWMSSHCWKDNFQTKNCFLFLLFTTGYIALLCKRRWGIYFCEILVAIDRIDRNDRIGNLKRKGDDTMCISWYLGRVRLALTAEKSKYVLQWARNFFIQGILIIFCKQGAKWRAKKLTKTKQIVLAYQKKRVVAELRYTVLQWAVLFLPIKVNCRWK